MIAPAALVESSQNAFSNSGPLHPIPLRIFLPSTQKHKITSNTKKYYHPQYDTPRHTTHRNRPTTHHVFAWAILLDLVPNPDPNVLTSRQLDTLPRYHSHQPHRQIQPRPTALIHKIRQRIRRHLPTAPRHIQRQRHLNFETKTH